ncbi:MAG: iron ABC transporter permease [Betaproteobacteria bacterium]
MQKRDFDPALAWLVTGLVAYCLLPWFAAPDSFSWTRDLGRVYAQQDAATGLLQAAWFGRWWLWGPLLGLLIAGAGVMVGSVPHKGRGLALGGAFGAAALLVAGFTIGMQGWSIGWLKTMLPALWQGQFGLGWGGMLVLVARLMLLGLGLARLGYFRGDGFSSCAVIGCVALLLLFIAFPVYKALISALQDDEGKWNLVAAAARLFNEKTWGLGCVLEGTRCGVVWNTLFLGLATAAGTTLLGLALALLAERGSATGKAHGGTWLKLLALLPIITPPFVIGLGLILLLGRAGLVNQFLESTFGVPPGRWLYGVQGVWLAQMFAFTPVAFLILRGVVQGISPSLEEAAQMLRANPQMTFNTVTLPLIKPGIANAFLVGFIESITDFGNPIVLGGQYAVLATDIFFAIVGAQLDPGRAASLGLLLLLLALAAFVAQRRFIGVAGYTTVSGKGDSGLPLPLPPRVRKFAIGVATPWLILTMIVYAFAFFGSIVEIWGRDYSLTLRHYVKAFGLDWGVGGIVWSGGAWNSFWTTIRLSVIAAPLTAAVGILIAYLLARVKFRGQGSFEFLTLLAFAIPGTVIGVSYILAFNVPPFELTGTGLIIVLCFLFRSLPVGVQAGTAALRQLDKSLDEASAMLRAGTFTTLRRVVLPLLRPAIVAALVYSFVRSMTTVSAVIFLVTAEHELATTYIVLRVTNGDYGLVLAYCTVLILMMLAIIGAMQWLIGERRLGRRSAAAVPAASLVPVATA